MDSVDSLTQIDLEMGVPEDIALGLLFEKHFFKSGLMYLAHVVHRPVIELLRLRLHS